MTSRSPPTQPPSTEALGDLRLAARFDLRPASAIVGVEPNATWLQRRFRSFWGVEPSAIQALQQAVVRSRADVAIVIGLDGLPYFPALSGVTRVWFAADEWVRHHLSQLKMTDRSSWGHVKSAAIKGLYERAHAGVVDRAWVVSESERRAMRYLAGIRNVDVIPLGVDTDFFAPGSEAVEPRTAVFWGRLDFGPNIQALDWFCERVWPGLVKSLPDARFTIVGFNPTENVRRLGQQRGITVIPDLPDLRPTARRHALAVFPFVSGGGVKNKVLEAAALGLPIVCTPLATQGLSDAKNAPFSIESRPEDWVAAILRVWQSDDRARDMAAGTRAWVTARHSWTETAREAMRALESPTREAA